MTCDVLLVEDDAAFAQALQKRLMRHELSCQHALNASEALWLARQEQPRAVLLDMKLGAENGLTVLPLLRQTLPDARIVLLTGYASIATAVQAVKQGADDYLAKPVDTLSILTALAVQPQEVLTDEAHMMSVERVEWEHIQQVLALHQGNISAAARAMNMHRRTLQRKLQKRPVKQ